MQRVSRPDAPPAMLRARRHPAPQGRAGQVLVTRVGLKLPGAMTFDSWERAGRHVAQIVDSSAWCLGDWIVYGQSHYDDRYRQAVEAAGLDYQTLRNYAWVVRRFPISRRRDKLSFQHHAEVASLEEAERERWLDRAQDERWSRNRLRQELRHSRSQAQSPVTPVGSVPRLDPAPDQLVRWQAAAERGNASLSAWIVQTLDRVAESALDPQEPSGDEPTARPALEDSRTS